MKIAVINFSGNVGKTTVARHLLLPRIQGAELISVESVNTRTLQSTIKAYVEENDGLSEDLAKCISIFDTYDITRRRESSRATKGGKK